MRKNRPVLIQATRRRHKTALVIGFGVMIAGVIVQAVGGNGWEPVSFGIVGVGGVIMLLSAVVGWFTTG